MIHQYQLNGYNIVLDICSGAVHLVDELAYDMISLYERQSWPEIRLLPRWKFPAVMKKSEC